MTAGIFAVCGTGFFTGTIFAADENITEETTIKDERVFSDVDSGHLNYIAIKYLKENGLVDGYEDGSFKPDNEVNRAEALKMIIKAVTGKEKENSAVFSFEDVKTTDWFYDYVLQAWNYFLVQGYPDGLFHPERTINLAESMKIILNREGSGIPSSVTEQPYKDVAITDWYAPYAQIAKDRTIVLESRDYGYFYGDRNISRGQMSELLYRTIRSKEGSSFARATWYADLLANQSTASGEPYIPNHFTAAHKTLPFGTILLVTNLANGKSVEVTVNDRGPYATGVDLDLSKSAFAAIASVGPGRIYTAFKIGDGTEETSTERTYGF